MSSDRRYSEDEIAAIFKQAAEAQESARQHLSQGEGLTLAELQQIGQEAGITPAFIARAAAAVDHTGPAARPTTYLGLPVSVARTVELPGSFSDADWERLVVDLRETFQATGKVRRDGSLREWRNGNLHALIEPTEAGHRLHLRTLKGNARTALFGGLLFFAFGLAMILTSVLAGDFRLVDDTIIAVLFAAGGMGTLGLTAYQLPRWVEERGSQMDAISARALQRAAARQDASLREPDASPPLDFDPLPDAARAASQRTSDRTRT